jgi:hypothetical protein
VERLLLIVVWRDSPSTANSWRGIVLRWSRNIIAQCRMRRSSAVLKSTNCLGSFFRLRMTRNREILSVKKVFRQVQSSYAGRASGLNALL